MDDLPREMVFTPSQFVDEYNAALEAAFPVVVIEGELLNYKIAQKKWVYADVADDYAKIRLFGSVFKLNHQLADGMKVKVVAIPRLHPQYGLSLNIESITPVGEGNIKKAAEELTKKLSAEGLFDITRKRQIPRFPSKVGLITSGESAAYADFVKIMNARWKGVEIILFHTLVQGDKAPEDICHALNALNAYSPNLDVIVLIRGGGSPEDLQAFSAESVVRAVANSRTPTIAGIGHEIDVSLTEMAADLAASTPSNAAELLFPDSRDELRSLSAKEERLILSIKDTLDRHSDRLEAYRHDLREVITSVVDTRLQKLQLTQQYFDATNPTTVLSKGYTILTNNKGVAVVSVDNVKSDTEYTLTFHDGITHVKKI